MIYILQSRFNTSGEVRGGGEAGYQEVPTEEEEDDEPKVSENIVV
jgi:hypothetical protein